MQYISTNSTFKSEKTPQVAKRRLLSLYFEPPQIELTLDEFELLSLDRLQLLRAMEVLKSKNYDEQDYIQKMNELEKRHLLNKKDNLSRLDEHKRDIISHFILRLAYCRTEELRKWYLTQECALLKYRLDYLTDLEREMFMNDNGLSFDVISNDEKNAHKDKLIGLTGITPASFIGTSFYRIPFIQALQLIGNRQVYIKDGFAWVPLSRLVSIIVTRFRTHLSRALVEASNSFDLVGSDTRIGPLLKNMNKQFIGNDFSKTAQSADKLTPDLVNAAAENDFPLCMKNLHMGLKRENKLKHSGRVQYNLFLKGAGMDLESANIFWESYFTKIMSHDQFVKGYGYMIRHMHGKEGSRKNYTPFSCMKIIMSPGGEPGTYHGCPYKHMGDAPLANLLGSMKLGSSQVKDIVETAKQGQHFQIACQKHFDITHPDHTQGDAVANHPNQWYQASVNYHKLKNGQSGSALDVKTEGGGGAAVSGVVGGVMSGSFNAPTNTTSSTSVENVSSGGVSSGSEQMEL